MVLGMEGQQHLVSVIKHHYLWHLCLFMPTRKSFYLFSSLIFHSALLSFTLFPPPLSFPFFPSLSLSFSLSRSSLLLPSYQCATSCTITAAQSLKGGSFLEELDLSHNNIHDPGAEAIASALPNSSVATLDVSHNPMSQAGLRAIIMVKRGCELRSPSHLIHL